MITSIDEIQYGSDAYEQCKMLRQDVLRTPIKLVLSDQDTDGEELQMHFAAMVNDRVVGVIIMKPLEYGVVKFRQLAVSPQVQGKGVGRDLVLWAENLAMTKGFRSVEMSARVTAQVFYEKLGYNAVGDVFTEVGLNTIKMVKRL